MAIANSSKKYLKETYMIDYTNSSIRSLIRVRGWKDMPEYERVRSIYNYVRKVRGGL